MRIALSLLAAVLLLAPSRSSAATIVEVVSDESFIEFGQLGAEHHGHPAYVFHFIVDGMQQPLDWDVTVNDWVATSGPLLQQIVSTDALGTTYFENFYDAGTFEMSLGLHNPTTDESRGGSFVAPIIGMHLSGFLPCCGDYGEVQAFSDLGPGLFDASIADALGIRQHSTGGDVADPYLGFLRTNDFPPFEFRADEGAPTVTIDVVPEPPLPLLALIGFGVAWFFRRPSRQLPI